MTKKTAMREKSDVELETLLADARKSLREERFAAAGARPKDSNAPRKQRRNIARILTEQHARVKKTGTA